MKDRKEALRRSMLARRAGLTPAEVQEASGRALSALRDTRAWAGAREVLLYMPVRNELDVLPLLPELWARGTRTLLPRCLPGRPGEMEAACVACMDELRPGAYAIPEPDPDRCPPITDLRPDLILVPGVAFDLRGYRLGFGGGYYDRLLGRRDRPLPPDTRTIGMAYSFQIVDELPVEPWDMRLNAVCTEERVLWPSP